MDRSGLPDLARVAVAERPPAALSVLRIHRTEAATLARLQAFLGGALPDRPGMARLAGLAIYWLAPFEWMIEGDAVPVALFLARECGGSLFHLCDVTDATGAFELEGGGVEALLAQGCSLDLHIKVFPVGSAAKTLCAGVVVLLQRLAPRRFRLWHDSSHRTHLAAWLDRAAASILESDRPEGSDRSPL